MARRSNIAGARIDGSLFGAGNRQMTISQTLSGTFTMDADMPQFLFLDPDAVGRIVLLPPEARGLWYEIVNMETSSGDLTVKDDSGVTTVGTIEPGMVGRIICNGTAWYQMDVPSSNYYIAEKAQLVEDFLGTWAIGDAGPADNWSTTAGSGTANAVATTVANSINGEVTLKSASDDGTHAQNCSTLTGINLGYKANQGGLMMEARLKISDVSEAVLFVGFTDAISTTVELPIFLVTTAIDSDATDAVGVGYDVDGTTKQFFHGGVKNGTDTTPAYSGGAPVDNTYFTVRVEVSAAGAVVGYIDGVAIGAAVADAVTITTALTPAIVIGNRSANQVTATIDYIIVEQNR